MPSKKNKNKPKTKKAAKPMKTVSQPSAVTKIAVTREPRMTRSKQSVVIAHKEYFTTVANTTSAFEVTRLSVNPGNSAVFPWLSVQAAGWERYRFKKLVFHYVPRCATTTQGTLVLAPDYDAADDTPPNEVVACSYADAVSCAPWSETKLHCNVSALAGGMTSKFVRQGALPSNLDVKTYDVATLFVARDAAGAATWGKLWVEYVVELITPHTIPQPQTSVWAGQVTGAGAYIQPPAFPGSLYAPTGGVNIQTAGPLNMYNPASNGANSTSLVVEGLIPGARYLAQLAVEGAASTGQITATSFNQLAGITEVLSTISNFTYSPSVGNKSVVLESIMQAVDTVATIGINMAANNNLKGLSLLLAPIKNAAAWATL
jgi:hypothetical protein